MNEFRQAGVTNSGLIDGHISLDFVREKLRDSYRDTGRPSIDPEVLYLSGLRQNISIHEPRRFQVGRHRPLIFLQQRLPFLRVSI